MQAILEPSVECITLSLSVVLANCAAVKQRLASWHLTEESSF